MNIVQVLMERDGMRRKEAEELVEEAKIALRKVKSFEECDNFCAEWFGLEPDYMDELL